MNTIDIYDDIYTVWSASSETIDGVEELIDNKDSFNFNDRNCNKVHDYLFDDFPGIKHELSYVIFGRVVRGRWQKWQDYESSKDSLKDYWEGQWFLIREGFHVFVQNNAPSSCAPYFLLLNELKGGRLLGIDKKKEMEERLKDYITGDMAEKNESIAFEKISHILYKAKIMHEHEEWFSHFFIYNRSIGELGENFLRRNKSTEIRSEHPMKVDFLYDNALFFSNITFVLFFLTFWIPMVYRKRRKFFLATSFVLFFSFLCSKIYYKLEKRVEVKLSPHNPRPFNAGLAMDSFGEIEDLLWRLGASENLKPDLELCIVEELNRAKNDFLENLESRYDFKSHLDVEKKYQELIEITHTIFHKTSSQMDSDKK